MLRPLRLYWGADRLIRFSLPIDPAYQAMGGDLTGAVVEFTLGLPDYLTAPLVSLSPTYTTQQPELLAGYFTLLASAYQPALATEQRHDLAWQLKLAPTGGGHDLLQGSAIVAAAH